jgi:hypothetical protein
MRRSLNSRYLRTVGQKRPAEVLKHVEVVDIDESDGSVSPMRIKKRGRKDTP